MYEYYSNMIAMILLKFPFKNILVDNKWTLNVYISCGNILRILSTDLEKLFSSISSSIV